MTDAGPRHLAWTSARIEAIEPLSPRIRRVVLRPQIWHAPIAGQHVVVRLTAPDGYTAQRDYSLLSPPGRADVYELAIERLDDGEVSPWFHDAAQTGDEVEVRGPVGGHFVWQDDDPRPVLLIGGGSGVVPLIAMLRHRMTSGAIVPMHLLYAARTMTDVILWPELLAADARDDGISVRLALSRAAQAPRPQDRAGRIDNATIREALHGLGEAAPVVYVCGSNRFVESITALLADAGIDSADVRTERFGG